LFHVSFVTAGVPPTSVSGLLGDQSDLKTQFSLGSDSWSTGVGKMIKVFNLSVCVYWKQLVPISQYKNDIRVLADVILHL